MSNLSPQSDGTADPASDTPAEQIRNGPLLPDTTSGSLLHWLVGYNGKTWSPGASGRAYIMAIAITYLPLVLAAAVSANPLWKIGDVYRLTFLHDWGMAFAFLVSFPTLVALMASDEQLLSTALKRVQDDGVLHITEGDPLQFSEYWKARFKKYNISALVLGAVVGIVLGLYTFQSVKIPERGFWIIKDNALLPVVGYAYLYCIVLLYALVVVYVLRCVSISIFLNAIVTPSRISLLPFHPDKCGGLRPVGRLGLRNQYTLTILGLNIVLLLMDAPALPARLLVEASVAYMILGPIIFMGPLLPFRSGMIRTKEEWMREAGQRLQIEFERLRVKLRTSPITKEDEEMVDRLRKIGSVIEELPVWPFDSHTLRKFTTAYVVPLGLPLAGKAVTVLMSLMRLK